MKHVLVVDDTKNIRLLLTKCLELEGYTVKTANDGHEALEMFKSEVFDLAFLDIKMPQVSGTEVLKRIRELGINTPVIIITAYATVKNAVECTQMGAVAYIQKPFTADKVRSILNDFIGTSNTNTLEVEILKIEAAIEMHYYTNAIELLKKTISIDPTNSNLYLLYSKAYLGMNNDIMAEKFYSIYKALNK